jgi:Xaa-Pro aminopeptidase
MEHFTEAAKQRLNALRSRLAEMDCPAYVSLAAPNNQYLTGFTGTTSAVLVTSSKALFLCDFRYTEQAGQQVRSYDIEEVSGNLAEKAGEYLKALDAGSAVFEPAYLTVEQRDAIQRGYQGTLRAAPGLVSGLRMRKSPEEVETIREALGLAEGVLADLLDNLDLGMKERDLAARFEFEFKKRGATGASFDTIALFGPPSSLPHGQPSERRLDVGDPVLLDFGCRLAGYCSDLTRTYAFGTMPGPWFDEIYELALTAQRIAIEAVRPGIAGRELDAVARGLIADAGYGDRFGHGLGHGVGIEIHEGPVVNPQSETTLEEGMVVTIEPGIYLPGKGGVRIEDMVVVTADGCEVLTTAPKDLRILHI